MVWVDISDGMGRYLRWYGAISPMVWVDISDGMGRYLRWCGSISPMVRVDISDSEGRRLARLRLDLHRARDADAAAHLRAAIGSSFRRIWGEVAVTRGTASVGEADVRTVAHAFKRGQR